MSTSAEYLHLVHPKIPAKGGIFEGFAVELADESGKAQLDERLDASQWKLRSFGNRGTDVELTPAKGRLSNRQAWDRAYELRDLTGVNYAEPMFAVSISDNPAWLKDSSTVVNDSHDQATRNPEWSLEAIRAKEAWKRFFPDPNKPPGHGVVIGHPDTGYQDHPELQGRILASKGYDFLYNDNDAHDDLERPVSEPIPNPGHGTGTASVIVSPIGAQRFAGGGWVTGVAPAAEIIPLRSAYSVMLLSSANLARAVEYAADNGAAVISISMGGLLAWRLRQAIAYARSHGVIICAAAGNYAPFVGWPAAYDEVIACAASNVNGGTWKWGCRGKAVDVTAPGESVWRATVRREGKRLVYDVGRGNGTSLATTATSGLAALWLSHHGRDSLVARYGAENIPDLFTGILRDTCVKFPGWKEGKFGAGLIDAVATLAAPLPEMSRERASSMRMKIDPHPEIDRGGLVTFRHLFDSLGETELTSALTSLLQIPERDLPAVLEMIGQELAFHLATDPRAYHSFREIAEQLVASDAPAVEALRNEIALRASSRLKTELTSKKRVSGKAPPTRSRFPKI
jgi:thermitase